MSWLTWTKVYIWLPLLILIPALYLVNAQRLAGFAPVWVKIPMQAGCIVSSLLALGIFWGFGKFWVQRQIGQYRMVNAWQTESQSTYNSNMEYINNYSEETIQGLLKFAHPENDTRQRTAAIAKIKSFENWENDLINILEQKKPNDLYVYDDFTYYVFAFLDGNKIEHPEKFIQPIIYSLTVLTNRVKKSINDPYNLDLHRSDVEVVCRVLDAQFKISAKEFRPDMVELQKALEITAPERKNQQHKKAYMKALNNYRLAVKNWLKSNS